MRLRLTNCSIIDSVHPEPLPRSYLDVEDGRIRALGPAAAAPDFPGAQVLDLGDASVTPGLFDCHTHLLWGDPLPPRPNNVAAHTLYCQQQALIALRSGFTGLRSVAEGYFVDVALRDSFNRGDMLGPRIWASGHFLTPTAGHCAALEGQMWCIRVTDGVEDFRKAAREQLQNGTDFIKLAVTGGAIGPESDVTWATKLSEEEIRAAAEVALSRGKRVIVHAAASEGVKLAIRCGAYCVDHGYFLDEETVDLMVKHGTFLVPTLGITHLIPDFATDEYEHEAVRIWWTEEWKHRRARERAAAHERSLQLAVKAGVKIANGSDTGPFPKPNHVEIDLLVRFGGMTPFQAIVAATKTAAECCGVGDDTGTLEVGKRADLIAVEGNPLADMKTLRRPILVLKDGQIATNTLAARAPVQ